MKTFQANIDTARPIEDALRAELERVKRVAVSAIPTNWLDPILSGDKSVFVEGTAGQWGCPDIERLLLAIKDRVADSIAQPREGEV